MCNQCRNSHSEPLKLQDMDVECGAHGFTFRDESYTDSKGKIRKHIIINMYVEDDEHYHYVTSFDAFWLDPLIKGLQKVQEKIYAKRMADAYSQAYELAETKWPNLPPRGCV